MTQTEPCLTRLGPGPWDTVPKALLFHVLLGYKFIFVRALQLPVKSIKTNPLYLKEELSVKWRRREVLCRISHPKPRLCAGWGWRCCQLCATEHSPGLWPLETAAHHQARF